jgi:CBS domain containing-hemolysin-like protein
MTWMSVSLVLLLAAVSLALASVEAAFYLSKRRHLAHLAHQNPRAELLNSYLDDPPSLLMPVHMGAYTAHVAMTVIITSLFLDLLAHWAILAAFVVMLVFLFLFRLTLPYALVRRHPERALLRLIPVFHLYAQALAPVSGALRSRLGGRRAEPGAETDEPVSVPPLEVPPPPVHDVDETRLASALARFSETQVREVMTPRPDIEAISANSTIADLRRAFKQSMYSRIAVFEGNLDDVTGIVTVNDLVDYDGDPQAPLKPLVRPVLLVPETQRIAQLLKELQAGGRSLAMVIDEYGGTAGLVSVEDIVEELVGEIKDEYDVETEPIVVEPDGAVLVAGRVSLDRLEEALESGLAGEMEVDTVGGWVTTVFARIPRVGEVAEHRGFTVEVVDAERKRVNRVRFRRRPTEPSE